MGKVGTNLPISIFSVLSLVLDFALFGPGRFDHIAPQRVFFMILLG